MTWLLVLVIGSMLVATGFAERAAMNMPCCSEHRCTNCHAIRAEWNRLDAQAARYEDAAANLWEGPLVKNLTSPTTPGGFEFAAKPFRDEAKADRAVAASHEEMAKNGCRLAQLRR
jgi:hypothetical protein